MNLYFEFGGGLGDIFFRIFAEGEYRAIQRLSPGDHARISLITINPFADELFQWHPKRELMDIMMYPHWMPKDDARKRAEYGLPSQSEITQVPHTPDLVEFYPCPSDQELICQLQGEPYFVIAASAGTAGRTIPDEVISMVCGNITDLKLTIVGVGRNYPDQHGGFRYEPELPTNDRVIDLIDQLSVPGVAKLIEGAVGVICAHSSVCLLAWFLNKPVLLLYPKQVYRQLISISGSGYSLGLNRSATRHALFDRCNPELVREFSNMATRLRRNPTDSFFPHDNPE